MAMHYILDGYNIIKRSARWADLPLDAGREQLLHYLETIRPQGSRNNRVTVVFDGKPGLWRGSDTPAVKVVFSGEHTADDDIKAMVDHSSGRKTMVIVTDDREICYYVRACGAGVLGVDAFLSAGGQGGKKGARFASKAGPAVKHIPAVMENKINEEMRGLWLKKDKKRDAG